MIPRVGACHRGLPTIERATLSRGWPTRLWLVLRAGVLATAIAGSVAAPTTFAIQPPDWPSGTPPVSPAPPVLPAVVNLVWHGSRQDRVVALTFDDGYAPATVRQIIRILVREKVPATFFVNGAYVRWAPALWKQVADLGFAIGNHSYRHADMTTLTTREIVQDLQRTRRVVEQVTGRPMAPLFRPPYGSRDARTDAAAAAAGFPNVVMWDVTGGDSGRRPSVTGVARGAEAGRPGSIVLLHAGPSVTPRSLPAIIRSYRDRGFRFVTVPELLGLSPDPAAPLTADPAAPGTADLAAGADAPPVVVTVGPSAAGPTTPATGFPDRLPETAPALAPVAWASAPAVPEAARAGSWARRDGTRWAIGECTAAGLVLLVALAATAGRRGRRGDESRVRVGNAGGT